MRLAGSMVKCVMVLLVLVVLCGVGEDLVWAAHQQSGGGGISGGIDKLKEELSDSGLVGTSGEEVDVQAVIFRIINWLLSLVAVLALLAVVVGGVMYVVSFGNDQKTQTAKKIIMYAIIGVLIAGMSFAIIATVRLLLLGQ